MKHITHHELVLPYKEALVYILLLICIIIHLPLVKPLEPTKYFIGQTLFYYIYLVFNAPTLHAFLVLDIATTYMCSSVVKIKLLHSS